MAHTRLLFFFLLSFIFSFAQKPAHIFQNEISSDSLQEYLFTLSADSMEGRETGRIGQKRASYYICKKYDEWSLVPKGVITSRCDSPKDIQAKYLQDHPISLRYNKKFNLSINGEDFLYGKDFAYACQGEDTTIRINKIEFIALSYNRRNTNRYLLSRLDGGNCRVTNDTSYTFDTTAVYDTTSTAMVFYPLRPEFDSLYQRIHFLNVDIKIVFVVSTEDQIKELFLNNSTPTSKIPVIRISPKAAEKFFEPNKFDKLVSKAKRNRKPVFDGASCEAIVSLKSETNELRGQNILAMIPGNEVKDETIVISAHYDHLGIKDSLLYPGADDNASGTSALLEMSRVFMRAHQNGNGPKRNILFINFSGEEKGLLGSSWFVTHPTVPLGKIVVNLNIDMIGRIDSAHEATNDDNYVYVIGSDRLSSELRAINETENKEGPRLNLDYRFDAADDPNRFYSRSDHYNFAKNGIPVIFYFDGKHKDYHTPGDTPEKINIDLMTKRTRLVFLTAWELANRSERIIVDKKNNKSK